MVRRKKFIKKSCQNCKALRIEYGTVHPHSCTLGYSVEGVYGTPLEICPKPKTYARLDELNSIKDKYNLNKSELAYWKFI